MNIDRKIPIKVAVVSGLIALLVYLRALSCGFVNLDDPVYVLDNSLIRHFDWSFFSSVFTNSYLGWWMPLTWVSLALDYQFWTLNPFGYHLTNIVLHAVNTGLVVLIAARFLTVRHVGALADKYNYPVALLLVGLLWGIHPLRVESVAWITERKDVLNGVFTLGSILFYLRHVQMKESGMAQIFSGYYLLSLGLFLLSLMAKSVSVVIPAVLLVLDWWPLARLQKGKIRTVLIEKIPFFVVSAIMAAATIYFTAEARYLISNDDFPFWQRVIVSGNALFEYCRLLLFPVGIIPLHLIPDPIPFAYTVKALTAAVMIVSCLFFGRKTGWLSAMVLCFVLPLLPVLAFFQNGDQAFASRFTYLPSIAPCIGVVFLFLAMHGRTARGGRLFRFATLGSAAVVLLFYMVLTLKLITVWNNSETLWNRIVEVEPSAPVFKERAFTYVKMGKYNEAVNDYSAAIKNPPAVWLPYVYNLYAFRGEAQFLAGRHEEAVQDFSTALSMFPHPVYYRLRADVLHKIGRIAEAGDDLRRAGGDVTPLVWYWSKLESQR